MSPTAAQTTIDPLSVFIAGGFARPQTEANGFSLVDAPWPMPLVATRFDVLIDSGLAVVTTSRTFRNAESQSIEAVSGAGPRQLVRAEGAHRRPRSRRPRQAQGRGTRGL